MAKQVQLAWSFPTELSKFLEYLRSNVPAKRTTFLIPIALEMESVNGIQ
jgi:hypothetical protein